LYEVKFVLYMNQSVNKPLKTRSQAVSKIADHTGCQ